LILSIDVVACGRSAAEVLAWSRAVVQPALRETVANLPAPLSQVAGYHFGWLDASGAPDNADAGKAIRPALTLLCAQAADAQPQQAVAAAVAVELVHNFSLLHDDVMDRDRMRRHRATAWTVFGSSLSILTGDALLALAPAQLAATGEEWGLTAIEWLNRSVVELCVGQAEDLDFEKRDDVRVDECLRMARAKTGSLLGCSCALGALAGGAGGERTQLLREFGERVGLAFQLVDDLLGIWGDPKKTGKPVFSDLVNRKQSLPVVAALNSGTASGGELAALYLAESELDERGLAHAADLIERSGGRAWAQRRADEELAASISCLRAAACPPEPTDALIALATLMVDRDR
jgi:geranylgeranyl diphosphate synthase type I